MKRSITFHDEDGFGETTALSALLARTVSSIEKIQEAGRLNLTSLPLDIFVIGFGLRDLGVVDLLALLTLDIEMLQVEQHDEYQELKTLAETYNLAYILPIAKPLIIANRRAAHHLAARLKRDEEARKKLAGLLEKPDPKDIIKKELVLGNPKRFATNITQQISEAKANKEEAMAYIKELAQPLDGDGSENEAPIRFDLPDHTLPISDIRPHLARRETIIDYADQLVYGDSPIRETMTVLVERFRRELAKRPRQTRSFLFILSDGGSSDGDPVPQAEELRKMGVSIISCLVADREVIPPYTLYESEAEKGLDRLKAYLVTAGLILLTLPCVMIILAFLFLVENLFPRLRLPGSNEDTSPANGLHTMVKIASPLAQESPLRSFLRQKGWRIGPYSRLCIQANHPEVFEAWVQQLLEPLIAVSGGDWPDRGT